LDSGCQPQWNAECSDKGTGLRVELKTCWGV